VPLREFAESLWRKGLSVNSEDGVTDVD